MKMFDVLTDAQWTRLQNLIDNPPHYIKEYLKQQKKYRDEAEKQEVLVPGPDSWQPGDPIPEEYRQERNTRRNFPRPAN
jgi:Ni/Co efflux regulator RcnB